MTTNENNKVLTFHHPMWTRTRFPDKELIVPTVDIFEEGKELVIKAEIPEIKKVIDQARQELGTTGRVLIRYSGTQPLLRVMVEGPEKDLTTKVTKKISDTIKKALS